MSLNLGTGVSRTLESTARAFFQVILQQGKPPMDAEDNLSQNVQSTISQKIVNNTIPSGFLGSETNTSLDFITNPNWSNWFQFGRQNPGEKESFLWANVNGWFIPVVSTRTGTPPGSPNNTDTWNKILLDPPPANSGDNRIDFVFLEAWLAKIAPNPSTANKPSAATLYRYGNVEGGQSYLPDDLVDPDLGFETAQRVQIQYRIRVVSGLVGLNTYPDGFDPSKVKGQGAAASETAYTFQNMRKELNDPGLWRAGDGTTNSLGTVDGYTYAIPIAAVFRRNAVTWNGDPSQNLNGGFNRNPSAINRTGAKTFSTIPTLAANMTASQTTATLVSATNIPLPSTPATPVLIQIGDELMTYASITGTTISGIVRGVNGSKAETHASSTPIYVLPATPDGLFSDQITDTDILDLRHIVNPNGFNYETILQSNLDKLLKGELRSNWKRSGAGPQGPLVRYQDKITAGSVSLGVTKLDAPDNIRTIFSDAITVQPVEIIVQANSTGLPAPVNQAWSLNLACNHITRSIVNQFSPSDAIRLPVSQLKAGVPGGDSDQIKWLSNSDASVVSVEIRIDGENKPLSNSLYTVTPTTTDSSFDLTITFGPNFPVVPAPKQLYIKAYIVYGAGRGMSRRPDFLHNISLLSPNNDILRALIGVPSTNYPLKSGWAPLWSKYQHTTLFNQLPLTSESYVDYGSKTVILQPFRRIDWPDDFRTLDGTSANYGTSAPRYTGNAGTSNGSNIFEDLLVDFTSQPINVGHCLVINNGGQPGRFVIRTIAPGGNINQLELDRPILTTDTGLSYDIYAGQGLMPLLKKDGVTPKWATTDPLMLFSGTTFGVSASKDICVILPRHLMPCWGEYRLPNLNADSTVFSEGINCFFLTNKGAPPFADSDKNYIPYSNGSLTYAVFSTLDFNPPGTIPAVYNSLFSFGGKNYAGIRKFTDTRNLKRQGLELPPFYGLARLFAVYEANDYKVNGSAYDATTRAATGSTSAAKNLLRQNFDGPLFWIELDDDGDSTFILNAEAIDITKSPNVISNFAAGNYVIEASVFGFDRNTFNPNSNDDCRIVLTRPGSPSLTRSQANDPNRLNNINVVIASPNMVLPGPLTNSDSALINFSRTPYGGDAWGSQTNYIDIGFAQGPLQSATAYQISSTTLNQNSLTRPNQKVFEVLASIPFITNAGTGRISGTKIPQALTPFGNAGYEIINFWPPTSPIAPRPNLKLGALEGDPFAGVFTGKYAGCTERLPLGALWRDKDFRGCSFSSTVAGSVIIGGTISQGFGLGLSQPKSVIKNVVNQPDYATGQGGEFIVHVDGEQGNYALLNNYRTFRGGSAFSAGGDNPGGEVFALTGTIQPYNSATNVLSGIAYLVKNTVTNVGAAEVSAGQEIMMVIVTSKPKDDFGTTGQKAVTVGISTNGFNEGYSAADIYRVEGHFLVSNSKITLDPSTITLTVNPGSSNG